MRRKRARRNPPAKVTVDLYEASDRGDKPLVLVIRHQFFGRTEAEAKAIMEAHTRADAFLRAGLGSHDYHGTTVVAMM